MKESIEQIAKAIENHRIHEEKQYATNLTIARSVVIYDGKQLLS